MQKVKLYPMEPAIAEACKAGDINTLRSLTQHYYDIESLADMRDDMGNNLLHLCAVSGSPSMAVFLCDDVGVDWNARNLQLVSPLHVACEQHDSPWHEAMALCLYRRGADVLASDANGCSPFDLAGERLKEHFANLKGKQLTSSSIYGLNPSERLSRRIRTPDDPENAFLEACKLGNVNIVGKHLLEGIDPNTTNIESSSALYLACEYGNTEIVQMLLEYGADVNRVEEYRNTPLLVASSLGYVDVVELLISNPRVNITKRGLFGRTAATLSAENGHGDVLRLLTNHAPELASMQDGDGYSPLHYCALNGNVDICVYLVEECKVDLFSKSNVGKLPQDVAIGRVKEYLYRRGNGENITWSDLLKESHEKKEKSEASNMPKRVRLQSPVGPRTVPLTQYEEEEEAIDEMVDDEVFEIERATRLKSVLPRMSHTQEICRDQLTIGPVFARGSSGDIKAALLHTDIDRRLVVIKTARGPRPSRFTMEMMSNEVAQLSRVQHTNIAKLIGTVLDPDFECLVSELAAYGSLSRVLASAPACRALMSRGRALIWKIAYDVARGMEYLHSHGIVHRDLRAANVVLSPDPFRALISDLGLAGVLGSVTGKLDPPQRGVRTVATEVGALTSLAPEAFLRVEACSEKIDVFSYAILLVDIFCLGRTVYGTADPSNIARNVATAGFRPNLPEALATVPWWRSLVERCWQHDPAHRPAFCEIVRELEQQRPSASDLAQSFVDFHTTGLDMRDSMWRSLLGTQPPNDEESDEEMDVEPISYPGVISITVSKY